jgi:3-mercaptopyruvate sulfurtransferase SseA
VVRELRRAGWTNARALVGGWRAWQDQGLPVRPKDAADTLIANKSLS